MPSDFFSQVLRFADDLRVVPWDGSHVFLVGDERQFLLTGESSGLVAPEIDGKRDVAAIVGALQHRMSASEVVYTLQTLLSRRYLVVDPASSDPARDGFWSSLDLDPTQARQRLASTPVAVDGRDADQAAACARALADAGLRVDGTSSLRVLVTDDVTGDDCQRMHRRARAESLRWIPLKPRGSCAWVGPVFVPGGPCWACLASRLSHNRPVETYLARAGRALPPRAASCLAAAQDAALRWSAVALARWVVDGGAGALGRSLLSLDADTLRAEWHPVVRRPQCQDCGDPTMYTRRAQSPVRLAGAPRRVADDGGYRVESPEETYARLAHHVSPITGLVASVEPLPGRHDPLRPVFVTTFRACPTSDPPSPGDFHRHSAGKGRTVAQAKASALCEALERISAISQGDEPCRLARWVDLGEEAVHPDALQNFSDAQRASPTTPAGADARVVVPRAFDVRAELEWTPAWSLTRQCPRWLPSAYCYSNRLAPNARQADRAWCVFNPNGHAAGSCLEEAVLQAFLELVERDAVAIWWYNRLERPAVDLETFGAPYFTALRAQYRSLGWSLWVLDVTHDLEIPCFVALARAETGGRFAVGFGCHLDARLAVQRALTELNQLFDPAVGSTPWGDTTGDAKYLFPSSARPVTYADFAAPEERDLGGDVLACVKCAADAGLETLVIDQSRPDVEVSAVKVVVPGLRHIWPRLAPGRLYDVPVRCRWLTNARAESALNPVPLLL